MTVVDTNAQDSDASGGQTVNAASSTNVNAGNNTYWIFSSTGVTRFWVASSPGNWSNPLAWSLVDGGTGGAGAPQAADTVVFDGNGLGACTIDAMVNISTLTISSITAGGFTGTINAGANLITLANGFTMSTGTFNAGGSTIAINGDMTLNAGVFNAGGSTITLAGNWNVAGSAVFTYGTGSS